MRSTAPRAHRWSSAIAISSSKGRASTAARRTAPLAVEKRTPGGGAGGKFRAVVSASIGLTPRTGTCRPLARDWLARLLAPLADPQVAASLGRQGPGRGVNPIQALTTARN